MYFDQHLHLNYYYVFEISAAMIFFVIDWDYVQELDLAMNFCEGDDLQ